jgi:IS5 family transposase
MNTKTQRRSPKRPRQKRKRQYRIRNWGEYNQALKQRGSLTFWVDEAALAGWCCQQRSGKPGAAYTYSESAIVCALTLQAVYHLPLRATEGLLASLLGLLAVWLPVPDYSTLCKRRQTLSIPLPRYQAHQALHLVVDATGFKVFGEGEWKVRQHGWSKHRTWRKLHLGVNAANGEIVAALVSQRHVHDKDGLDALLAQVEGEIDSVYGDGGYDFMDCYVAIDQRGARAVIPPRCNAALQPPRDQRWQARNANLARIKALSRSQELGRKRWKRESGYHRRSLVETGVFRLKCIFGDKVSSRHLDSQANELFIRCAALNRITSLGLPQSYPI